MDTGIDVDNPEFEGKIDFDNSHSYFVGDPKDISEPFGSSSASHGTHVARIAAARKDGEGIHGVAFESELVIFKGINARNRDADFAPTDSSIWALAIDDSIDAGAHVMNNSWGPISIIDDTEVTLLITTFMNPSSLKTYLRPETIVALDRAVDNDLMIVFGAGNSSLPEVSVNAGIPVVLPEYKGHFIAVVAVDVDRVDEENIKIADYSNHCGLAQDFCLAAPGDVRVYHDNGHGYALLPGTSFAAPHVTGAYAVLKSQWPDLTAPVIA
ncbi:S8 family peptidase, partial [uncultured Tateyamaria sp.]|uniref:S8 family peptidase n=1 Tax=uncultured Tateyamaria sp. TaxID=455651 RepID=UPI00260E3AF6